MSPHGMKLPGMLLIALLAFAAPSADAAFWTTPDPVVAGQPARVVFTTWSYGGQPEVEVQVDGEQIVLLQTNLCAAELCFSARIPAMAEATLPPLEPGTYTVLLVWAGEDDPPVEAATLQVQATPAVRVLPADGFWAPVDQPGSGLFLERRGDLLAVSLYSYADDEGQPYWLLGTSAYAGDKALLLLRGYSDGDCLGCADHRAPTAFGGGNALQLRFESARRAWLDIARLGRATITLPVTSLPYGAAYLPHTLTDAVDAEFGPLPLPDLRGGWIFAIEGADAPAAQYAFNPGTWSLEGDVVRFGGDVECRSATEEQRAGCTFSPGLAFSPPLPEPLNTFYGAGWFVPLGDIQEDRMRGVFEADGQTWRVQGFRTAPPPPADTDD